MNKKRKSGLKSIAMAVEEIDLRGQRIITLRELLRPGLKAVFIGLNPAPVSVQMGHFYQGRHGRQFWNQLTKYQICGSLPPGAEDDVAFAQGYGFADLIRRPTKSSSGVSAEEKSAAAVDLGARLSTMGDHPLIVFRYKKPYDLAGPQLVYMGYRILGMPNPYMRRALADSRMRDLQATLGIV